MQRTKSGILIPNNPSDADISRHLKKTGRSSLFMGIGALVAEDGEILWQDEEWQLNALHNVGQLEMLNVNLKGTTPVAKYLSLANDASADTVTKATVSATTESFTPGSNGCNRQQILTTEWTNDGIVSNNYRFSAVEKTFGPVTGSAVTATHSLVCDNATTAAAQLLATLALSATTTIAVNQSFKYILRWAQQ